ncbi:hypothetical protein RND71_043508 [Anisodus tanguticus]|uniref:DhaK domain-containing protein n=1 Tax=Anisodus tanguticus TaxID=243964 RepID=A0AAE1QSJ5_9SOLA|nr:hypothetical protein RND71_043508 [Anisodus tanguticus]
MAFELKTSHFINNLENAVRENLLGIVKSNDEIQLISDYNIVIRKDLSDFNSLNLKRKVALISGGGSGHEPFSASYVSKNGLDASVSGEIFSSPSSISILTAIQQFPNIVTFETAVNSRKSIGEKDIEILLILINYTGDRLNFGLAAEQARFLGDRTLIDVLKPISDYLMKIDENQSLVEKYKKLDELSILVDELTSKTAKLVPKCEPQSFLYFIHFLARTSSDYAQLAIKQLSISKVQAIDNDAFRGSESTLTALDLSSNELTEFPSSALTKLPILQWLSLKGNRIEEIRANDLFPQHNNFLTKDYKYRVKRNSEKKYKILKKEDWIELKNEKDVNVNDQVLLERTSRKRHNHHRHNKHKFNKIRLNKLLDKKIDISQENYQMDDAHQVSREYTTEENYFENQNATINDHGVKCFKESRQCESNELNDQNNLYDLHSRTVIVVLCAVTSFFTADLFVHYLWKDPRLNITSDEPIRYTLNKEFGDQIWKPDTVFKNGIKGEFASHLYSTVIKDD